MNAQHLAVEDGPYVKLWRCSKCSDVYRDPLTAGKCCCWKCSDCSRDVPNFYTRCDACSRALRAKHDQEILDKATVVENYEGCVYAHNGIGPQDGYFPSLGEFIEYIEENCECDTDNEECVCLPEYVHTCVAEVKQLDLCNALENLCEDGYEDMAEGLDTTELYAAVDKFNEENKTRLTCYSVDTKHKVFVGLP